MDHVFPSTARTEKHISKLIGRQIKMTKRGVLTSDLFSLRELTLVRVRHVLYFYAPHRLDLSLSPLKMWRLKI